VGSFDKRDKGRYATFSRRTLLLSGGMMGIFGVLAGRLYQLQIVEGDDYLMQAEDNRINDRLLAPPRGRIVDRFGVSLASSRRDYRVLLVPEQAKGGIVPTVDALTKILSINDFNRARILKAAATNKAFMPIVVNVVSKDEYKAWVASKKQSASLEPTTKLASAQ